MFQNNNFFIEELKTMEELRESVDEKNNLLEKGKEGNVLFYIQIWRVAKKT